MAKAVTLKNSNNETVYPVTDASLISGTIKANQINFENLGNHYDFKDDFPSTNVQDSRPFSYTVAHNGIYNVYFLANVMTGSSDAYRTITVMKGNPDDWGNRQGSYGTYLHGNFEMIYNRVLQLNAGDLLTARVVANGADFHLSSASFTVIRIG